MNNIFRTEVVLPGSQRTVETNNCNFEKMAELLAKITAYSWSVTENWIAGRYFRVVRSISSKPVPKDIMIFGKCQQTLFSERCEKRKELPSVMDEKALLPMDSTVLYIVMKIFEIYSFQLCTCLFCYWDLRKRMECYPYRGFLAHENLFKSARMPDVMWKAEQARVELFRKMSCYDPTECSRYWSERA